MDGSGIAAPATVAFARQLIKAEQLRQLVLERHFTPAEWQVLLELFVAVEEGRLTAITDMGLMDNVPRSTALGIVADLTRQGLLIREPDPADGRRFFLSIEKDFHSRINALLLSLMQHFGNQAAGEPDE